MKFTSAVFSILVSSIAQAAYQDIPMGQLEAYKTAVKLAGEKSQFLPCKAEGTLTENNLSIYLQKSHKGQMEVSGAQPILVFYSEVQSTPQRKAVLTIVSDNNYQKLVSIKLEEQVLSDVNLADLRRPRIVKAYVTKASAICEQDPASTKSGNR